MLLSWFPYFKNKQIGKDALFYVKKNKKQIIKKFVENSISHGENSNLIAMFMAGSPGAGKTEFSKRLLEEPGLKSLVRIDPDEIREILPKKLYTGKNSDIVQRSASKGAHLLFDYVMKKKLNFLLDGTFSNLKNSKKNIERLIKKEYKSIDIWYIYQDPIVAWNFVKRREALDGRKITKQDFVEKFFKAIENVNEIKRIFKKSVKLNLIVRNMNNEGIENFQLNIDNLDSHLKFAYNKKSLYKVLKNR